MTNSNIAYRQVIHKPNSEFLQFSYWGYCEASTKIKDLDTSVTEEVFVAPMTGDMAGRSYPKIWSDPDIYIGDILSYEDEESYFTVYFDGEGMQYMIRSVSKDLPIYQQRDDFDFGYNRALDINLRYCKVVGNLFEGFKNEI